MNDYSRYLFAYGTLMQAECRHPLLIPAGILSITPASVPRLLFHLGEYPGMVLSDDASRLVKGELIELPDLCPILDRLDKEEGSEYHRSLIRVTTPDGNTQLAWSYILAEVPRSSSVIESGDWRDVVSSNHSCRFDRSEPK
jgi:gamma-glutamylcyclotransferase (GGCT)/AIG2-like uncharacterized protein YtfP